MAKAAGKKRLLTIGSDRSGSVAMIVAVMLPVLLAIVALVAEYGSALVKRTENQRISDLAAYAGAVAYSVNESEAEMIAAARSIAALNGVDEADVTVEMTESPRDSSKQAVSARIRTRQELVLAGVIGVEPTMTIFSQSFAGIASEQEPPACLLALDPDGPGITMSGGTRLDATGCVIGSNENVHLSGGASIIANEVAHAEGDRPDIGGGARIDGPNGTQAVIEKRGSTDPFAGSAAIAAARARVAQLSSTPVPTAPTAPVGSDIDFSRPVTSITTQALAALCTVAVSSTANRAISCPAAIGSHHFKTVRFGGGQRVEINADLLGLIDLGQLPTITFSEPLVIGGGATVIFGAGHYVFAKGLEVGGGATVSFGRGSFKFGTAPCGYSLCAQGNSLTFDGPSSFELRSGMNIRSNVEMGAGSDNSYRIGPSSNGTAISVGGGNTLEMADATGAGSLFEVVGNISNPGGGSCTILPAAAQHDIAGYLDMSGALILGAGQYNIAGYLTLGKNGGGSSQCGGRQVGFYADQVSLVFGSNGNPNGNCRDTLFCLASGYNNVHMHGPSTGPLAGLLVIGPETGSARTYGVKMAQGASGSEVAGAIYVPNGPIELTGGAGTYGIPGSDQCLHLLGSEIEFSQGGSAGLSECESLIVHSDERSVALIQ